jgi:rRNA maturation endonuclease Nob1
MLRLAWWDTGTLTYAARGWHSQAVVVPDWLLLCILLILPVLRIRRFRMDRWRQRRQLEHLCQACGYDLRATRDRCPECGTPIRERVTVS